MAKLSFLIYLADVSSTANGWAIGFGIVFGIVLFVLVIIDMAASESNERIPFGRKALLVPAILFVISVGFSVFIPSQKAIYLIAGVEAAKELSSTEIAKEAGSEAISVMKDVTRIIHSYAKKANDDDEKHSSRRSDRHSDED